jgi:hypothetical protein
MLKCLVQVYSIVVIMLTVLLYRLRSNVEPKLFSSQYMNETIFSLLLSVFSYFSAPPTYSECIVGDEPDLRSGEGNEHTKRNWNFAPKYITYPSNN